MIEYKCDNCGEVVKTFSAKEDTISDVVNIPCGPQAIGPISYTLSWKIGFSNHDICRKCLADYISKDIGAPRV